MKEGDVGIEELLRKDAEALARDVNAIDEAAFVRQVLVSLDALANVDAGASVPGRPSGAGGPHPGSRAKEATDEIPVTGRSPQSMRDLAIEMRRCIRHAEMGDPSSSRRLAELIELRGHDAGAWWRRAAALGDPDALDYVENILDQDSSTGGDIRIPQQRDDDVHEIQQAPSAENVCQVAGGPHNWISGMGLDHHARYRRAHDSPDYEDREE